MLKKSTSSPHSILEAYKGKRMQNAFRMKELALLIALH